MAAVCLVVTSGLLFGVPTHAAESVYSRADVAQHAKPDDCWTIVRGAVYDVTAWIPKHPAGQESTDAILRMCGADGTAAFEDQHITDANPRTVLDTYRIGYLPDAIPSAAPSTPAPSASPTASAKRTKITCIKGKKVQRIYAKRCPSGWRKR